MAMVVTVVQKGMMVVAAQTTPDRIPPQRLRCPLHHLHRLLVLQLAKPLQATPSLVIHNAVRYAFDVSPKCCHCSADCQPMSRLCVSRPLSMERQPPVRHTIIPCCTMLLNLPSLRRCPLCSGIKQVWMDGNVSDSDMLLLDGNPS